MTGMPPLGQTSDGAAVTPTEIRLDRGEALLHVTFEDGTAYSLPAEYLRVESPSAEVQGHTPAERRTVSGKRHVGMRGLEPVGHYAVRIIFDDGHDTGIYTWDYLRRLGREQTERWAAYLHRLADKKLTR
ncbi:Hypothetical protein GbCGDNIH9_0253 [Granulibacter bethesdensis]|uniref:Gamma-butyrobetaine hydroxylase-like N-terminal domain-containing protein n=1 Tax=Granulibacter bethesdensis TaxID=364410 RepID=A0AAC9K626_9PROT|nr:DUF971 domain-containing protein [Granulibacter bethesdensis]APH53476.1 Hypothetical protein GbCGDNIH9_0253 [Granulibacter bethesdensis]APH61054.1 Hypothetical protein GbCGDNIH8_0253 [Granulibacter bethesdensis]